MGGGSVRIHQADIQSKMFEVLGFTPESAQEQFGFPSGSIQRYGVPKCLTRAWHMAWTAWVMLMVGADLVLSSKGCLGGAGRG